MCRANSKQPLKNVLVFLLLTCPLLLPFALYGAFGVIQVIVLLSAFSADMSVINVDECTALHFAAATGDINCCKFLAQRGIETSVTRLILFFFSPQFNIIMMSIITCKLHTEAGSECAPLRCQSRHATF